MTHTKCTLLDELEIIDRALLEGEATARQEARGQQIVQLANAAPKLFDALQFALPFMEDLANSSDNANERRAARLMRDAIAIADPPIR
jgi:hypothetical protein